MSDSAVQVAVRVRPMLASEAGSTTCVEVLKSVHGRPSNMIRIGGVDGPTFTFDQAFDGATTQTQVFESRVLPLVHQVMDGYNASVLAYGQTSSGKTYSVLGPSTALQEGKTAGIIPRAIRTLFQLLKNKESETLSRTGTEADIGFQFDVRVQLLELYGEEIRDLLTSQRSRQGKLTIRDIGMDEPEVLGATQQTVESADEALLCLTRGMLRRVTGETAMNASSSRSHAIMSLIIQQTFQLGEDHAEVTRSRFNFVDLAGSERQKRTKAEGKRLKEGIDINKGLLTLGNVISALGDPKQRGNAFVPYRDSKLTRLLKGSLGGNHKTLMIACLSPSSSNIEESLNCLRYANRAKNIQNKAVVNVDPGTRLVSELKLQIQALAAELLRVKEGSAPSDKFNADFLRSLLDETSSPAKHGPASPMRRSAFNAYEMEKEMEEMTESLRRKEADLQAIRKELFAAVAEKETYRLASAVQDKEELEDVFVEKAATYEAEIATLRAEIDKIANSNQTNAAVEVSFRSARSFSDFEFASNYLMDKLDSRSVGSTKSVPNTPPQTPNSRRGPPSTVFRRDLETPGEAGRTYHIDSDEEASWDDVDAANEQAQIEASLNDISKSIDDREALIGQLRHSQEKFESMRGFYKEKLAHMESQVRERELERGLLVAEIARLESTNSDTKELQKELREKENQISGLRKRHKHLANLSKVSSRNEAEIIRLRNEVITMKKRKADLQKMIAQDRRSHMKELQRLKRESLQREKALNKLKRESGQKERDLKAAQAVARTQTKKVGELRAKYRETERKLRVRTVKRGVMEKAGLDPVITGRRQRTPPRPHNRATQAAAEQSSSKQALDIGAMRKFLDERVEEIWQKEAIANHLAIEWEDHMELSEERDSLLMELQTDSGDNREEIESSIEAIEIQLRFKVRRIRELAAHLGKWDSTEHEKNLEKAQSFLDNSSFKSLYRSSSQLEATRLASRILFGMVVRERRRVAALARVSSSLDEKLLSTEEHLKAKDSAFFAYIEAENHERVSLAQSQQEQILSLMAMVQEQDVESGAENESKKTQQSSRVLVLANERIEALEEQVRQADAERQTLEAYKMKERRAMTELNNMREEHDGLQEEYNRMRSHLIEIQEAFAGSPGSLGSSLNHASLLEINGRLIDESESRSLREGRKLGVVEAAMVDSDSDGLDGVPEWAGDIMADLEVIADGGIPETLLNSPGFRDLEDRKAKGPRNSTRTVFDRLTNPENFTGIQKKRSSTRTKSQASRRLKPDQGEQMMKAVDTVPPAPPTPKMSVTRASMPCRPPGDRRSNVSLSSSGSGSQKSKAKKSMEAVESVQSSEAFLNTILGIERNESSKVDEDITTQVERKVANYTQQNVFERLQKTTTRSYAVKHTGTPSASVPGHPTRGRTNSRSDSRQLAAPDQNGKASLSESHDTNTAQLTGYTSQNVFERLQKTTTQAYASKQDRSGRQPHE